MQDDEAKWPNWQEHRSLSSLTYSRCIAIHCLYAVGTIPAETGDRDCRLVGPSWVGLDGHRNVKTVKLPFVSCNQLGAGCVTALQYDSHVSKHPLPPLMSACVGALRKDHHTVHVTTTHFIRVLMFVVHGTQWYIDMLWYLT